MLIQKNEEIAVAANAIENRLGVKLKLMAVNTDESKWRCTFTFDPEQNVSEKFVVVDYDLNRDRFQRKWILISI